ncbi:alkaline phosphatase family protein [Rhizobium sp. 007]|uniref:alkaline phosphatase family protein n=1 Tax=Rhizobium sp. 007 TaxID=2785056 RepID=UPI00188E71EB|nr:alkaline phosphatase family protein [Rhizobium sp. 007]QPB24512.1 alkaline phosphatase family protein [Rhizobium sp. 007]
MSSRAITVILDGLRRDLVRPETMPNLLALTERGTSFEGHRSTAPSVTRVCASTFATGCFPSRHTLEANTYALEQAGRFVVADTGLPDFLALKKRLTGQGLAVPTMAERLRGCGGVAVFSNVSPGAAYVHDPEGFGHVYHRAGSFGPGRRILPEAESLSVSPDLNGDAAMAERFIAHLEADPTALSIMWCGHPDTTQHEEPLGSPVHLAALRHVDQRVRRVADVVDRLRGKGEDILFIVGADHGHQTVHAIIDVDAELRALGQGDLLDSGDLAVAPNGTAVLLYAREAVHDRVVALADRLRPLPWVGQMFTGSKLAEIGQATARGLAMFISLAETDEPNAFDIPGQSYAAKPLAGKPDRLGCGQHGGLGRYEQSPFLVIDGAGFPAGTCRSDATSIMDLAPTIAFHLNQPTDHFDGRPLQSKGTN